MFVPNDDNLLVSCAEDGVLACTDRRTAKVCVLHGTSAAYAAFLQVTPTLQALGAGKAVRSTRTADVCASTSTWTRAHDLSPLCIGAWLQTAWELRLHTPLHSVTMRWDGSLVAVGTGSGRVLVHDTRAFDSTLAAQEFSDELPVTALCWQHMPTSKSHKRNSLGATAAAAANTPANAAAGRAGSAVQVSQGQAGAGPGSAVSAAAAGGARSSAAGAAPAGARGSAGGASAQQPHKTPLVVPGWDSNTPRSQVTASTSSEPVSVPAPLDAYALQGQTAGLAVGRHACR